MAGTDQPCPRSLSVIGLPGPQFRSCGVVTAELEDRARFAHLVILPTSVENDRKQKPENPLEGSPFDERLRSSLGIERGGPRKSDSLLRWTPHFSDLLTMCLKVHREEIFNLTHFRVYGEFTERYQRHTLSI